MRTYTMILIRLAPAIVASVVSILPLAGDIYASQFHVTSGASANGTGSLSNPWQFQTALNQPSSLKPGDTIWVHAGTYTGMFVSALNGSSGKPIIVRNFVNDRVTIVSPGSWQDGIQVNGSYTWFWGLEVTSDPTSPLDEPGSGFNIGIGSTGDGIRIINCIVHDQVGGGFGWWLPSTNAEINGCLIYYNGREVGAGNNAHNYGIYMQNVTGRKLFKDNIDGYNWSYASHVYSEQQGVDNITFDGDVLYQSGYIWRGTQFERNLIMGGVAAQGRDGDTVRNCHLYYSNTNGYTGGRLSIGYDAPMSNFSMTGNTVVGGINELSYTGTIAGNTFVNTTGDAPSGNTYTNSPSGTQVIVRPNDYELGRANIIVYNWDKNPSVNVDFSSFLAVGSTYTVKDAENFYGPPVATGTYNGGTVSIPMNNTAVPAPMLASGQSIGAQPFNTQPEFGIFVVTGSSGGTAPAPTATFSASPSSLTSGGGSVTLTWSSQNATSATISGGVGAVALSGSTTVTVNSSTTFTLTLTGPGGTSTYTAAVTVTGTPPAVPTGSLTASPATLASGGGTVTLTWSSQNATSASISGGVGAVALSGSTSVTVSNSTTFTLTLTGPGGTSTYAAAVTVTGTPPAAPTGSLNASPAAFASGGGTVTLTWSSQNATSASISPGVGSVSVSGSTTVNVTASTSFKLTLNGPGGTASYTAAVTVSGPPPAGPTGSLSASPATLASGGGSVTLTWTSTNATSATIAPGVGTVALSGSTSVNVTSSTTFTLHLSGPGGTASYGASVTVNAAIPAPTVNLTASPDTLPSGGGSVTLEWSSQNATAVNIAGIGSLPSAGSLVIDVSTSSSWILVVTGPGGSVSDTVSVYVPGTSPPPPPPPANLRQPEVSQNFPNPFNGGTTIRYVLPAGTYVTMTVYSLLGAIVARLVDGEQEAGYHEVRFNSTNLSSGVYYYSFVAGSYMEMRKMIYLK